jgi:aspartyl-tRNA(Asn)/glutamyl-tRNA(Gln) amidotransferase subunit A
MTTPTAGTASETASRIRSGAITSTEYVEALLRRIHLLEPTVQAWARLAEKDAGAEAACCDAEAAQGRWRGPLHGIAVAVKDNFDTAGLATEAGSSMLAGRVPARDAQAVSRLRSAGAIVLGKTAMTAFAAMDPAATRNPWNVEHTPGGSSSGSAAAVAASMCSVATATQTAGSILRPAAYCGVCGLKPTYDAVPRGGIVACAWSMDHAGAIARNVDDLDLMFRVLSGRESEQAAHIDRLVVAVPDRGFDVADAAVGAAVEEALAILSRAGVRVVPVRLPPGFEALAAAGIAVMYAEMAAFHRERLAKHREQFPPRLLVLIEEGMTIPAADYINAQRIRRIETEALSALLESVTALATPTTATAAPAGQKNTGDWSFNLPFSASGHPAITLPCGFDRSGLPLGLQLVAAHGREDLLFALGRLFQQHSDWHERRPSFSSPGMIE